MKSNPDEQVRQTSRSLLGGLFITSGVLHFAFAEMYLAVMPPYLDRQRELVAISGFFEVAGGLGLFPKRTRRAAGWGLIALLLAVWPANFQMLSNAQAAHEPAWKQALLWARLPLQVALIYWVWRVARECE